MTTPNSDYDIVIVGGRPEGASLAARLGALGHRLLLLDRAQFPSPPGVPSAPILHPGAMAMLDELGIPEADYAAARRPVPGFSFVFDGYFDAWLEVPSMSGRDYVAGLDRVGFDEVLWRNVARFGSVERREGFTVNDLIRDASSRVIGVVGSTPGGPTEQLRARAVIGADGRFSLVARKAGASIVEQETRRLSTVYFAQWEGVAPVHADSHSDSGQIHTTGRGLDVLCVPIPGDRLIINTHERADRVNIGGNAQSHYLETVMRVPSVAKRLSDARQVSDVLGVKRIGNGYRKASGPGWALVGDAAHYKDPVDGQGIYDALLGAKLLSEALHRWLSGAREWDAAMADYASELWAATHPMFVETLGRLRRELYEEPPALIIKTLIRWTMTDPTYQSRFLNYLGRTISPTGWSSPKLIAGAVARGIWRDLTGGRGRSRSAPNAG